VRVGVAAAGATVSGGKLGDGDMALVGVGCAGGVGVGQLVALALSDAIGSPVGLGVSIVVAARTTSADGRAALLGAATSSVAGGLAQATSNSAVTAVATHLGCDIGVTFLWRDSLA